MNRPVFYSGGSSAALTYAARFLKDHGWEETALPSSSVTHLLLPVPSFDADGKIKGGVALEKILPQLPKDVTVIGGNLKHAALKSYRTTDLLLDTSYLAVNADITAYCAIRVAMEKLPVTLRGCPVLVIGWGRIGKCLAKLLRQMGARVAVAARKESDKAMLAALGYAVQDSLALIPGTYRLIYNTVPAPMVPAGFCEGALKIELASKLGIQGDGVIWARGLPGLLAPESSGKLIAETVHRIISEKEVTV